MAIRVLGVPGQSTEGVAIRVLGLPGQNTNSAGSEYWEYWVRVLGVLCQSTGSGVLMVWR